VSNAPFEIAGMRVAIASLEDAVEKLERENAEMRHSEENLAATVRGLEFELEKAQKTADFLRGTVEALGDANDRLTIEVTALRKDKERLDWLDANDPWERWEEVRGNWIVLKNPIRSDIDAARAEEAKQ
jgi:chromosome segregation ATPase